MARVLDIAMTIATLMNRDASSRAVADMKKALEAEKAALEAAKAAAQRARDKKKDR